MKLLIISSDGFLFVLLDTYQITAAQILDGGRVLEEKRPCIDVVEEEVGIDLGSHERKHRESVFPLSRLIRSYLLCYNHRYATGWIHTCVGHTMLLPRRGVLFLMFPHRQDGFIV